MRQECGDTREVLTGVIQLLTSVQGKLLVQRVQDCELLGAVVDEEGGSGGWGLDARVGYGIEHRLVALMADAHDDGQRHLCYGGCKGVAVEIGQVAGGTAATDDDDAVPSVGLGGDGCERCQHALFDVGSLHDGGEETHLEVEAVVVVSQLVAEVAIAGSTGRRDYGDAFDEARQL